MNRTATHHHFSTHDGEMLFYRRWPAVSATRIAGARRLLLRQGICCTLQGGIWLAVIAQMVGSQ
jgi:hypothetical protein